ncbi:hypothetical protein [Stutzerimonas kunmingensis]|uniref:hypothetical protein n=1 Tax=Stutzerimonas kunmingensis TaxID=1211807 RepID=UPI0028A9F4AF|nr:hypothetical protein [Stutzerimonas kunmingensis]
MSRKIVTTLACHIVVCLLFPLAVTLGFKAYVAIWGAPASRGVALGLAVQLIFAALVLANVVIALVENIRAKVFITAVLVVANLAYLLPQHPLRALFFSGLSGGLTLVAIYLALRFSSCSKSATDAK